MLNKLSVLQKFDPLKKKMEDWNNLYKNMKFAIGQFDVKLFIFTHEKNYSSSVFLLRILTITC